MLVSDFEKVNGIEMRIKLDFVFSIVSFLLTLRYDLSNTNELIFRCNIFVMGTQKNRSITGLLFVTNNRRDMHS